MKPLVAIERLLRAAVDFVHDLNHPTDTLYWGYHLRVDARGGNNGVRDPEAIKAFNDDLIDTIDMVAHGEPRIVYFGEGHLAGWTLDQLIVTSNIMAHFNDDGTAYIDIFSCLPFDSGDALACISRHFDFDHTQHDFKVRQA